MEALNNQTNEVDSLYLTSQKPRQMHIASCMYHLPPARSYMYLIYLAPKMKNHTVNLNVQ